MKVAKKHVLEAGQFVMEVKEIRAYRDDNVKRDPNSRFGESDPAKQTEFVQLLVVYQADDIENGSVSDFLKLYPDDDGVPSFGPTSNVSKRLRALFGIQKHSQLLEHGVEIKLGTSDGGTFGGSIYDGPYAGNFDTKNADGWGLLPTWAEGREDGFNPVFADVTVGDESIIGRSCIVTLEEAGRGLRVKSVESVAKAGR